MGAKGSGVPYWWAAVVDPPSAVLTAAVAPALGSEFVREGADCQAQMWLAL